METRVGLWGGSCAIRLPKMAVETLGLHEGQAIDLVIEDHRLVISHAKTRYDLDDLVRQAAGMRPPESVDFLPVGEEAL